MKNPSPVHDNHNIARIRGEQILIFYNQNKKLKSLPGKIIISAPNWSNEHNIKYTYVEKSKEQ